MSRLITVSLSMLILSFASVLSASTKTPSAAACPAFLNHEFRKLHSDERINLCERYNDGKALLLVNTASHCGFTGQFKGLESLYTTYKEQGLEIIGFSSNDFNQAAKTEAKAADICYLNYGVSFTMLAPTSVKGDSANAVFKHVSEVTGKAPSWNFNKYLITSNGERIEHFGSRTEPRESHLEQRIKESL